MAWRSSGTTNDEMVDNLKREYCSCIVQNEILVLFSQFASGFRFPQKSLPFEDYVVTIILVFFESSNLTSYSHSEMYSFSILQGFK